MARESESTDEPNEPADEVFDDLAVVLDRSDVERMVRFVADMVVSSRTLAQKRTDAFDWIAETVGADLWMWLQSRWTPGTPSPAPLAVADSGFRDDAERNTFHQANYDPRLYPIIGPAIWPGERRTLLQNQMFLQPPEVDPVLADWQRTTGLIDCILSAVPLGNSTWSSLGLHRRRGSPSFTPRDRAIVHVMFGQLAFLHVVDANVPGNNDRLFELPPRPQQVLMYLLAGDQAKQVASKMLISVHTVNDHIKQIYRHFGVSSRGELLSQFRSGSSAGS
jgi:DNA-binding CsgD family transcriptional regulator